jgi:REP element-mobilizing transposase RayT
MIFPGLLHHVAQSGNRREAIFFEDGDHEIHRDLLAGQTRKAGVEVWAYCFMPDHVHLILAPKTAVDFGRAVGGDAPTLYQRRQRARRLGRLAVPKVASAAWRWTRRI